MAVDDDLAVLEVDRLAGGGDNALYEHIVLGGTIRVVEHHDVTLADRLPKLKRHLLRQNLIANLDRGLHGAGGHHKGLDHKRADQEGGGERDQNDQNPFQGTPQSENGSLAKILLKMNSLATLVVLHVIHPFQLANPARKHAPRA